MSLQSLLQAQMANSVTQIPPEALEVMRAADDELKERKVGADALKVGDFLPYATLSDATGNAVSLSSLNEEGPLIITFYRGGWCPYCNLELKAYQNILGEITGLGGQLIAISPEKPDNSLTTIEKNALTFPVLTDTGNRLAKALGIAFELPAELQQLFTNFGMNLDGLNAETGWALPIPATFVVGGNGQIVLADVDIKYTRRLEPSEALAALKSLTAATA
ncbi:redoxin domain-containing protein [Sphingorhabdus sp. Alg231-15]|uniref:redoxin domain-containing protein n=1 Tax=Sphingorhabdus sp. Alg231-15 TaxID=1922222 RepID=UPI000D56089E